MTTSTATTSSTASKAAVFGAVLGALWAAHDCADHLAQTDHQAEYKGTHNYAGEPTGMAGWRAMAGHVGGYHALQVAVLLALRPLGVRPSWWRFVLAVVVSASTHAILDRRWPVRWIMQATRSAGFADSTKVKVYVPLTVAAASGTLLDIEATGPLPLHGPYLADQACHHTVLLIAAWIIAA